MDELVDRITKAEIRIAYAEDLIDKLNDEIIRQNYVIEKLTLEIEKIKSVDEIEIRGNEKPPHY